ncbi:Regulator of chromosome condensation (RCC1) repeat-containing protein 5 [Elsinoe fawcettii]|nr:Regulator of chromosome condensation (RCC1) repeat-containing protein 5 [Elsinoe fawcettii]
MRIFALGSNGSSQLGLRDDADRNTPCELTLPPQLAEDHIASIASGGNHTLFLTQSGSIYATGDIRLGPNPESENVYELAAPLDLPTIKLCAATWSASIFVTTTDHVMTCGHGSKGEVGRGESREVFYSLSEIPAFPPQGLQVIDLSASMSHVVAVLSNGDVYGWGGGRQGQLGQPSLDVLLPRKIDGVPFQVCRAVCGKSFTCFFSSPEQGEVMILGNGKSDRFGLNSAIPRAIPGWKQISASWGGMLVLKDDGKLLGFGRNDRGQLGPSDLPPLASISAGSEHALAVTTDGKVLTWGWGEHGNCGEPIDDQKDVKGRCNTLEVPSPIGLVHGGCATSLIVTD